MKKRIPSLVSWLRLSKFDFCRFNIYFYILGRAQRNEEVTIKFSSPTAATYDRVNIFISSVLIIPFIFLDMHNEMKRWISSLVSGLWASTTFYFFSFNNWFYSRMCITKFVVYIVANSPALHFNIKIMHIILNLLFQFYSVTKKNFTNSISIFLHLTSQYRNNISYVV